MKKNINKVCYVVLVVFMVAGCAAEKTMNELRYNKSHSAFWHYQQNGLIFSTEEKPEFNIGDGFVYDDGSVEFVVDVDGKYIKWSRPDGSYFITHKNIFLPTIKEVISSDSEGELIIENHFEIRDNFLWPLRIGLYEEIEVNEKRLDNNFINQFDYKWSCEVKNIETINVSLSKFDVFVVECNKKRFSFNYETYTLFYSPEISGFAKIIKQSSVYPDKVKNIAAYGLMPNAMPETQQKSLTDLVQYALETRVSGNSLVKKFQDILMEVTPIKTFETDKGYFCREYEQKLSARGRVSKQSGIACRNENNVWKTPETQ